MTSSLPSGRPSDERVFAALAYLSILTGLGIFAQIGLYLWKRAESPLIAFHAAQALILSVVALPLVMFGWIASLFVAALVPQDLQPVLVPLGMLCAWLLPTGIVLWLGVRACIGAFRGERAAIPLIGRLAAMTLGDDASALPPR